MAKIKSTTTIERFENVKAKNLKAGDELGFYGTFGPCTVVNTRLSDHNAEVWIDLKKNSTSSRQFFTIIVAKDDKMAEVKRTTVVRHDK